MSQAEVGDLLAIRSGGQSYVSRIENGLQSVSMETGQRMVDVIGCTLEFVIRRKRNMDTPPE